jgi:hypothetical protein
LSQVLKIFTFFNEKLLVRADVTFFVVCEKVFTRKGLFHDLFCQWTKARMIRDKMKALGLDACSSGLSWPDVWLVSVPTLSILDIKISHSKVETPNRVWNDAVGS